MSRVGWMLWISMVGFVQWMWVGYDECDKKVRLNKCNEWSKVGLVQWMK